MTSPGQAASNRSNAEKSTGPKTRRGRKKSSQNARKHGLTAPITVTEVERYWRIIVNDALRDFPPEPADPKDRIAMRLAAAEAQVARANAFEEIIEKSAAEPPPKIETQMLHEVSVDLANAALHGGMSREDMEMKLALYQFIFAVKDDRKRTTRKNRSLAARYINEAEARRHKALKEWVAVSYDLPKQSQILL